MNFGLQLEQWQKWKQKKKQNFSQDVVFYGVPPQLRQRWRCGRETLSLTAGWGRE